MAILSPEAVDLNPTPLRQRLTVALCDRRWASAIERLEHYKQRSVHNRARPLSYQILWDEKTCGLLTFGLPQFVKQRGLFGYPDLPTQWQVVVLYRFWLHPSVQGRWSPDRVQPRLGRPLNLASCALSKVLGAKPGRPCQLQVDWQTHSPPRIPYAPSGLKLVLAYADPLVGHQGTIYRAANFSEWGTTRKRSPSPSQRGGHDGHVKKIFIYPLPDLQP